MDWTDTELIPVDLGIVNMTREERVFIWGAVQERTEAARNRGEHFAWADFVRTALLEAAQR